MYCLRTYIVFLSTFIWIINGTPVCEESYGYVEVPEDVAEGTVVKEIKCQPSIAQGKLIYTIKNGNTHGKFGVNSTNNIGRVYVYQSISFESRTTNFQLAIEVVETDPIRSTTNYVLDMQITGVNDYAPLFLFSPYTVYINEDKQPGSVIFNPIPYDFDKGADGATTSVILDGDDNLFYMDPVTAKVYLRSYMDYERQTQYVLTIQVTDNGIPERRSSTTLLNINVKDINDNAPVCEESFIAETFDETKEAGAVIKFLKCTDADPGYNGRLSYTITEGDYTKFRLQGPYLVLSKEIDVDTEPSVWSLTVIVRDRGNPRLSALIDIVIYVEGVDDNAPVWAPPENGNYIINIDEHSPIGKLVVRVSADDMDAHDSDAKVVYYMDDYSSFFTIKPSTGDIFLSKELDHEQGSTYTLPVSAVSHNNPLDRVSTNVIINVNDVNDNTPLFVQDVFQVFVSESLATKSEIATVTAVDKDGGDNGIIQYKIIGGNTDSLFDVQSKTGEITLMGNLDYETEVTHTFFVRASDKGRPTRWSTCTVIVSVLPENEFVPIFKDMETVSIPEDTLIGASVFTVQASDNDDGDDGLLEYQLAPNEETFVIESRTGIVRLLRVLDRETKEDLELNIFAADLSASERKIGSVIVRINVLDRNDNAPVCEKSFYTKSIIPPTASGDVIETLRCADADLGGNSKLSYSIAAGNTNSDFAMSPDGHLVVMQKPGSPLYHLEIEVSDNGSPSLDTLVLVVIDVGGTPDIHNLPRKVTLSERANIGYQVYQVNATSISQQLRYFIKNVTSDSRSLVDAHVHYKIDENTGKIFVWRELDREEISRFTIFVEVEEKISNKKTEGTLDIVILDENDNAPRFEKNLYNISVMENVKGGTKVMTLTATDLDLNENAELSFAILQGNEGNSFMIDHDGSIKVNAGVDRERNDVITLVITATDNGKTKRLTGSTTVLISILDDDEYTPEFINVGSNVEIEIPENTPLAAKLFTMKAQDRDVHRDLTYSIDEASMEHFIIESHTGDIFLSRLLDREKQDLHTLIVSARDDRVTTATVLVKVTDINDNDPVFSSTIYKFDVYERSHIGDYIGMINASDADIEANGFVSLTLTEGNIAETFTLHDNKLYVSGSLDYDNYNEYILTVEASDNGFPRRTSSVSVIIEVSPEYRSPQFAIDLELIHVTENERVGNIIYDADGTLKGAREGHGNDLMYSIETGNVDGYFSISRNTGEIAIARNLKKRSHSTDRFTILINAKNIYNTNLSDEMTLKIEIDDINDNSPTFEKELYSFNVYENMNIGFGIGAVSATDLDRAQNAFITYQLIQNEDAETFRIDPFVGTISLMKELDFMYNTRYQLTVIAFDNGSPRLTGSTYVTVRVIDVNDNPPVFEQENPNVLVRETYAVGRTIYQMRAHDGDTGVGGELLYRIVNGNENGIFELDSESGELTLTTELDRETTEAFTVIIEAEDKGTPSLTGSTTLSITVADINDNAPYFTQNSYDISIDRFAIIETKVLSVTALDEDKGENARVEYQISQDHDELFQIDGRSGDIFTFSDLTDAGNSVTLTVIAKDRGNPTLSTSVEIGIEIHPPIDTETEDFSFQVSEYASPNTFVGAISSTTSSSSRYTIVSGNYRKHFRISEEEGNLFLDDVLDRENYSDYYLHVRSTHRLSPNIKTDIYVHISVTDENDNQPQFDKRIYNISVLEHSPLGFSIASVVATDLDIGSNGQVSYSIVNEDDNEADTVFSINENGTLLVRSSVSYEGIDFLNFTIVAKDNGQYSRQGSCLVHVHVIDIDENIVGDKHVPSKIINFEVPNHAERNFVVGCLDARLFGINVSSSKLSYLAQTFHNTFEVNRETGCITVKDGIDVEEGRSYFIWVVAVITTSGNPRGQLALVRVDTFDPNKHVVVLTHSVSKEILDLNRDLLLSRLEKLFPSNEPKIWLTEDLFAPVRRKLLFQGSKSYIYVLRDNSTNSVTGVQNKKYFLMQNELLDVLRGPEDGVSHDLTSEDFDNFPVVSVRPYKVSSDKTVSWIQTTVGRCIIGVIIALLILAIIVALIVYMQKFKKNRRQTDGERLRVPKPSLSVPPNTNKIDPMYNNLRRASSTADLVPLMNALKILSGLNEDQRNKLIETTLKSKKSGKDKEEHENVIRAKFIQNKMKTDPEIKTSQIDETLKVQNLSCNETEDRNRSVSTDVTAKGASRSPIISKPITPFTLNTAGQSGDAGKNNDVDTNKNNLELPAIRPKLMSLSLPDDASLSSLDLDSTDNTGDAVSEKKKAKSRKDRKTANGPIVIGGKEYDGVGRDVSSGKKYLYNTSSGDKIYVSDDILKRAMEHRESVITNKFHDRHNAKISTFKKPPVKRKTSRTRFSTTTIWEMNVDEDQNANGAAGEDGDDSVFGPDIKDEDNYLERESSAVKRRRAGVDNSKRFSPQNNLFAGGPQSNIDATKGDSETEKKDSSTSIESIPLDKSADAHRKEAESSGNQDNETLDFNEGHVLPDIEEDCNTVGGVTDSDFETNDEYYSSDNRRMSEGQRAKFMIPKYKPLKLDNVECKVPKGKSDKKDCLSKDPFYAGWAKMIGRRMSTKTVRRKDGGTKTVISREGRSLPANLLTQMIPNKAPVYKPKRLMTLDIQ